MKKNNKKGFTLAELLIVVAIIAVLTAIAIPVFNGSLVKAKESADMANLRSAYAQAVTNNLTDNTAYPGTYDAATFGALNFPDLATWSTTNGLHVHYSATKNTPLELKSAAMVS